MKIARPILMALVATVLAAGTVFEKYRGNEWVAEHFYSSWWFTVLLGLVAVRAVVGIVTGKQSVRFHRISMLMLYPAVFLLALGIVIGAVWANISWGNYWSWDPKEVWALITLIVYTLPLHPSLGICRKPMSFHLYSILAFLSVIITYFGVNFLLGGMHAYG